MDYLVCYNILSANHGESNGDVVMTVSELSAKSIKEIRKWIESDLKKRGFVKSYVVFTSMIKLDPVAP